MQGPKRRGLPATSGGNCLQKNIDAFEAILRKDNGRKWVAFGISVKDGRDCMTSAENVGIWHRRLEGSFLPRFMSWFSEVLSAALLLRLDFSIVDIFAHSRMTSEYFYSPGFGSHVFAAAVYQHCCLSTVAAGNVFALLGCITTSRCSWQDWAVTIDELSQQSTSCRDINTCVNSIASTPCNCCFHLPRRLVQRLERAGIRRSRPRGNGGANTKCPIWQYWGLHHLEQRTSRTVC